MEIKDKKVLVIGAARSGIGAANLLTMFGADVTITDIKPESDLTMLKKISLSVKRVFGNYPDINGTDLIIVSPGVPLDIEPLRRAKAKGIEIMGELELAYRFVKERSRSGFPEAEFLAITGTNGKSTTTTLLNLMLQEGGFQTILGGNIGNALTEEIQQALSSNNHGFPIFIITEVSSFQLESIINFRPKVATILNITPDHLDRYRSMEDYIDAKALIFSRQQRDDFLVLNADDETVMELYDSRLRKKKDSPSVFFFSRKKEVRGIYSQGEKVFCNIPEMSIHEELIDSKDIMIKGLHNLENAMAASAMAILSGCRVEAVIRTLKGFHGLEHRLEFVRELDGIRFINDSKGTNVGAVLKSLEGFSEPVILIAGGRDKAGDFSLLRPLVKEKVKCLILIGEAREKIRKALGDLTETLMASSLEEAVKFAKEKATKGDVVLLSPACASFDMFRDFEDRGRQFKDIVKGL
ncbi:MAG: UDP-N-acetylmuramoyl-L-alanine--D-glutamate ligase [Thermodesulfovibrionales bacterium]